MARVKLMSAMAYDLETYETSGFGDPVIRVLGELPAGSRPFGVNRVYKGAQGMYEEVLSLADADNTIIWESAPRRVELRGEMFEDLFRRQITDRVEIASTREHTMLFYLDGQLAGRIPVFIDAPQSVQAAGVLMEAAETALKKGSICWLTIPQADGTSLQRPAWYVQQGQRLFVLKGDREQELPGLESASRVTITVKSKDVKAAIGDLTADVRVVDDAEEFEKIASLGLGNRLNLLDGEQALDRWKRTCTLVELTPHG
ncbi:MAG: hypothetical protein JJT89_09545 [Nitriliruptoraceae bacterium]|nr:hypothetical protein [Nitriliruptoraceae bacterium]